MKEERNRRSVEVRGEYLSTLSHVNDAIRDAGCGMRNAAK